MKKILLVLFVLLLATIPVAAQSFECVSGGVCMNDVRARALISLIRGDKIAALSTAFGIVGLVIGVIMTPIIMPLHRRSRWTTSLVLIGSVVGFTILGWLITVAMMLGVVALIIAIILFVAGGSFLLLLLRKH